ncbi:four-carbon acid sugar kinase family protein [Roseomonas sp. CAU 1739]|uniref:four-carbon acid sugar kinase family protein n=1 Tax=Roseomonas sp. CAU 1739 TaxID=3140364 RepID=UPI00325B18C3
MTGPVLRLLADDLTGALDTAAELTGLCGPVPVGWDGADHSAGGSLALDSGTREASRAVATARVRALAPALRGADIAFKKIDSLLRGQVAAELATCIESGAWPHVVLAPAFPAQGRITRGGAVLVRQPDGRFSGIAPDLPGLLAAEGLLARPGDPSAPLQPGLSVFDAAHDADLARIVARGRGTAGPVLWCGSGGLARALAGSTTAGASTALRGPVLGLFGSDQPATARQLAACGDRAIAVAAGDGPTAARIARMMDTAGVAMVSVALPDGLDRAAAALRIAAVMAGLTRHLPQPGTLIVAGGETLRAICDALGARGLEATGIVAPGVPRSVMRGGAWDGAPIVSKSGAFGGDTLWRDLLADTVLPSGSIHA